MYWTFQLASQLEDAPFPCTLSELIEYAERSGVDAAVVENLKEMGDDEELYENILDVWSEYGEWRDFGKDDEEEM